MRRVRGEKNGCREWSEVEEQQTKVGIDSTEKHEPQGPPVVVLPLSLSLSLSCSLSFARPPLLALSLSIHLHLDLIHSIHILPARGCESASKFGCRPAPGSSSSRGHTRQGRARTTAALLPTRCPRSSQCRGFARRYVWCHRYRNDQTGFWFDWCVGFFSVCFHAGICAPLPSLSSLRGGTTCPGR